MQIPTASAVLLTSRFPAPYPVLLTRSFRVDHAVSDTAPPAPLTVLSPCQQFTPPSWRPRAGCRSPAQGAFKKIVLSFNLSHCLSALISPFLLVTPPILRSFDSFSPLLHSTLISFHPSLHASSMSSCSPSVLSFSPRHYSPSSLI